MATKVAPSIFAADFSDITSALDLMSRAGVDAIHYDVMDNHFVPNVSFGPKVISDIAKKTAITGDSHLMIDLSKPLKPYIDLPFATSRFTSSVRRHDPEPAPGDQSRGQSPGISIKPMTPVSAVAAPYLNEVGLILVMSVEPGFSGQKFMPESIERVGEIRKLIGDRPIELQVDGGVGRKTSRHWSTPGRTSLVMGSAFFVDPDPIDYDRQGASILFPGDKHAIQDIFRRFEERVYSRA
jgi:ribulose-phosphate 3-epimerase